MSIATEDNGSSIINAFHSDKFKVHLSNFPSYSHKFADVRMMQNSLKSVTIPDISVNLATIPFHDRDVHFPMEKRNSKLPSLTLTYKADEGLRNYMACFLWAMGHRANSTMSTSDTQYESVIKSVLFIMADNQARSIARMKFNNCQFENLSALQPAFGKTEELDFTLKLKVHGWVYEVKEGGSWVGISIDEDGAMEPIVSVAMD